MDYGHRPPAILTGAEVWFSVIVGLIFIALGWTFGRYLAATLTHQTFHTHVNWTDGPLDGTEVAYWELQGGTAYSDSAIFLFGVALILDGVCLAVSARPSGPRLGWVRISIAVMLLAVLYNAFVCVKLLNLGPIPILSLLAVVFGGYAVFYQWAILNSSPRSAHRPA